MHDAYKKVFVAGASGVIGRRLSQLLIEDGYTVFGSTRFPEKTQQLEDIGVSPVIVDVFDEAELHHSLCKIRPAIVIQQLTDLPPGLDPVQMPEARLRNAKLREIGTRNLVAAAVAAMARRMIVQSIAFAYAPGPHPHREDAPLHLEDEKLALTTQAVAEMEHQVSHAPLEGVILRYGKLYGPDTGFEQPDFTTPVHIDAAADAARRAVCKGDTGIYNIAEDDGTVCSRKAQSELGWQASFRMSPRLG